MPRPFVVWNRLACEHGNASWSFDQEHRLVTVVSQHGSKKCTQLGGLPLEYLVMRLVRELHYENKGI